MLLLAQTGSVKIGEVVRYTVKYTPSQDRILPTPEKLYVRIRNTSNIALRAAFVHGPYTLCVATYPATYNPNEKFNNPRRYGVPSFEPMVKAGGSWESELIVPDDIRHNAVASTSQGSFGKNAEHNAESASWVIEVSSQVIFSTSVAVGYEVLVARDAKSLNLSSITPVVGGHAKVPQPGKLIDHQQSIGAKDGHHPAQPQGLFSPAIRLEVEDTASIWNTPRLPGWDDAGDKRVQDRPQADKPVESVVNTGDPETKGEPTATTTGKKQKKVHLVILTHGLHSNLGADMLFMKESIDAAAKQAKVDAKARKAKKRAEKEQKAKAESEANGQNGKDRADSPATSESDFTEDTDSDDEEVIVRGYSGNATKTEKGIKYLGKRLARYVLSITYPDQPFLPMGKGAIEGFTQGLGHHGHDFTQVHKHSTIVADPGTSKDPGHKRPYTITGISFIGHSLGGLVQTYAVAYIQKHSPTFFDIIKPINFIALASPFLGLSNENPLYVKFALDFGLVGRTGQDLGLTWRAPTLARSGWGAIVSNLGESAHKKVYGESQPESKPLLRILPTGPAHIALKKFRNRTVYSNVVNDGIVPLRTSCLLFLDWQGLGRVGKARREAGLVETVVGFGWAELTGANTVSSRQKLQIPVDDVQTDSGSNTPVDNRHQVPQPSSDAIAEDDRVSLGSFSVAFPEDRLPSNSDNTIQTPLTGFFNLFRSTDPPKEPTVTEKQKKILRRSQTLKTDETSSTSISSTPSEAATTSTGKATSGHELENDPNGVIAPPRTTFFESAGDLLNPNIPDVEYLIDPSRRPRTIFHDRVYHPTDIPPPPIKKRTSTLSKMKLKSSSSQMSSGSGSSSPYPSINHEDSVNSTKDYDDTTHTGPDKQINEVVDGSNMRVEEKIARGYHRDLSWRKVLVKLEPDAHNNIVVRRMFPNAYGWPVMKHLVDAHFSDSAVARMRDEDQHLGERALDISQPPDEHGDETKTVSSSQVRGFGPEPANASEAREALDEVPDLPKTMDNDIGSSLHLGDRPDSMSWSERDWVDSENESDLDFMNEDDKKLDKPKEHGGRLSPSGWNWAEKIVGKGATRHRSKSPQTKKKQA
ncbi:Putative lipase ROG1-like protein [Cladobotryum mycophilum]|uniref:Lipase ROG1-like protein n=1 Tax=Cladobotryum mycophilum TaxID=491253 RepID=A0ABR0T2F8_9HYPO